MIVKYEVKCKNCHANIRETLELFEEIDGYRVTKVKGIVFNPENFCSEEFFAGDKVNFELILGKCDEDLVFNFSHYQCSNCYVTYTIDEVKEIFKEK